VWDAYKAEEEDSAYPFETFAAWLAPPER
jgi:hypothetical protein